MTQSLGRNKKNGRSVRSTSETRGEDHKTSRLKLALCVIYRRQPASTCPLLVPSSSNRDGGPGWSGDQ